MNPTKVIGTGHSVAIVVLSLMFIVFAALQYNDPDPEVWIPVYLIVTLIGIAVLTTRLPWIVPAALMLIYLLGGILLWPSEFHGVTGSMADHPSIEYARESLGLFICTAGFAYYSWLAKKKQSPKT